MVPIQYKSCSGVAGGCQQVYMRDFIHHAVTHYELPCWTVYCPDLWLDWE